MRQAHKKTEPGALTLSSQPESSRLDEDEVLSPEPGRVKEGARQPSLGWRGASKSHLSQSRATPPAAPEGPLSAATTTCAALRRGPRLRLCAPPKTLRTLQPPPARFSLPAARRQVLRAAFPQPPLLCFGLQTFLPLPAIPTQGLPSRLRECGAGPAVGRQWRRSVPNDHFACLGNAVRVDWPRGRPRPARPPRASYPRATGTTPSPTFQPPKTTLSAQSS